MVANLEWKITGSPTGKISIARERVRVGRCLRCRLTELDEYYKIIVTIVKELEKIYSEKVLNLNKFSLNFHKCRNILKTRR
jgi:hypothetical protein